MRLARFILIAALLPATSVHGDPEQCREAVASYNQMVAAMHAAVHDYRRCLTASLARDIARLSSSSCE